MGASTLWQVAGLFELNICELFAGVSSETLAGENASHSGRGYRQLRLVAPPESAAISETEIAKLVTDYCQITDAGLRRTMRQLTARLAAAPKSGKAAL